MENNKRNENTLNIIKFDADSPYRNEVESLYGESFPDSERKPFQMILSQGKTGKMELYIMTLEDQLAGLCFLIPGKVIDVLDYLAVSAKIRGHKIGTRTLEWLKKERTHPFVVEIESTLENPSSQKTDRKRFYLNNEMNDCHTEFELFGVPMELLSSRRVVEYEEYEQTMEDYFGQTLGKWMVHHPRSVGK